MPIASPRLVRAVPASDAPVPPCATATSVAAHVPVVIVPTVVIESSPVYVPPATAASVALYACTSVPIASPRLVRAVPASDAPVPPCATATSVAAHVPVVIVPTPVKLDPVTLDERVAPVNEAAEKEPSTVPLIIPDTEMLPAEILPVALIVPLATMSTALTVPPVVKLPPVILPVALIVLVDVTACVSAMTVAPLILIAIVVLLNFELGRIGNWFPSYRSFTTNLDFAV